VCVRKQTKGKEQQHKKEKEVPVENEWMRREQYDQSEHQA
jgi:hypothetical protein